MLDNLLADYKELIEGIREANQKIEEFGEEINETLGNFEDKVSDINLND